MIEATEPRRAGRLLVADDDAEVLLALVQALELEGYDVTAASSGAEALAALRTGRYDVLLTDLVMPGLDGLALLRAGLELDPNLVGLIMSGRGTVATAVEALKLGAFDYVLKPYDVDALLHTLQRALDVRRVRLENLQLRETVALYDLSQAIAVALDADTVAQQTATAALQQMGADEAALLTLAAGGEALVVAAVALADAVAGAAANAGDHGNAGALAGQPRAKLIGQRVPLAPSASIAGWIARHGEPLLLNGPVDDQRFAPLFPRSEISSAIGVPMIAGGQVVGVLTVNALVPRRAFTPGQLKALSILANAGAAALANAALVGNLRESEARYRELIDHATDGILTTTPQGEYIEANSRMLQWLGYSREELLRLTTREVVAPDDQPAIARDFDAMRAGQVVRAKRRLRRKDGSWLDVELSGRQLPDGNFQAIMRDISERLRAEQALRDSEARFAALFHGSPAAISLTTLPQGRFVAVNDEFERLTGFSRDELLGQTVLGMGLWPGTSARNSLLDQLAQRGAIHNVEQQFRRKSGEMIDTLFSAEQIELEGVPHVVSLVLDVTERKLAEQALRESEARFAALFQTSPAAITVSSLDGRIIDVNTEFERAMGYRREEVVGRRAGDLGTWMTAGEHDRLMQQLAEQGTLSGVEVRYRRKSGEIMHALSSFETVEVSGQRFIMTLALDITERKQAEDQLRFQARLLSAVGQAVIATDPAGIILYWNHMAEKLYGWTSEEVMGQSAILITPITTNAQQVAEIRRQVQSGQSWTGEFVVRHRNGRTFPALVTDTPFYDRNGALAGMIGISTDISESKQRQREVEAIAALSAALRRALTREQIEQVILDQLTALLDTRAASLTMLDPVAGELVVEQANGEWAAWRGTRDQAQAGIVGHVVATGEPYVTADAAGDALFIPREAADGLGAVAVLPLIAHGQAIGGLNLARAQAFSDGDLRLLRSVADIAANALQRASLHDQTRLRAEQLAAVNQLSRALAETLELGQIYERLDAATRHLLPQVAFVAISLYDPELQLLLDVYRAQDGAPLQGGPSRPLDAPAMNAQSEVIHTRRPVIVSQANSAGRSAGGGEGGMHSSVFAPLLAKGEVVGVLQALCAGGQRCSPDDAELLATVANTAAVAIENARLFAETQRRLLRLQALRTIDLAITSSMDANISLRVLVDQAARHLEVDAVQVLLLDAERHRLEPAASHGFKTAPHFSLRVDEGNAGRAFMERRLLRVPQLPGLSHGSTRAPWIRAEGFVAYFAMPLVAKGQARGVLEVFHRAPLAPNAEWIDFLETLAEQAAIALDNSALFTDLQRSNTDLELAYDTTLEGWSRAMDLRDKETEGHTQRVTDLSERLARAMGLGEAEMVHLRRGALLHDMGKMGIPDSILLKAGPLTVEDWTIMRKHPDYAFELLAPIPYLRPALDIPYCHHEKWDGTGYPRGLKGDQIPLAARVFAVVDVWDALRSDRPYRPAWPEDEVREYIRALAGTHFDPRVVAAFMGLPGLG